MRRLLFFSFLILSSFQCFDTVDYDGSRRIHVSGKIVDQSGEPIVGISYILVPVVGLSEEGGADIASSGVTDEAGSIDFVIADSDAKIYKLLINRQFSLLGDYNLQVKTISNLSSLTVDIDPSFIQNFEMDLGIVTVKAGTNLSLSCKKNAPEKISYLLIYTSDTLTIDKTNFNQGKEFHLDIYNFPICDTESDIIQVSKNSRILLSYYKETVTINDTIFIGQEPVDYVFK